LNIQFETGHPEAFIEGLKIIPMQALMRFYRQMPSLLTLCIDWSFTNVVCKNILLSNTDAIHIETFEQKKFTLL
jgi:hypothetical protein